MVSVALDQHRGDLAAAAAVDRQARGFPRSTDPRIQLVQDMGIQPKMLTQESTNPLLRATAAKCGRRSRAPSPAGIFG